jgi:C4-dicarboxylate-specific signal transduction histidine kinase
MIGHTALPRIISLSLPIVGLAYLAGYVFLDWISFIHPFTPYANITPWNPPTGLSFVLVLLFGQRLIPLLFVAPLLGDFAIRELPMPWPVEIVTVIVVGGGYSVALLLLLSPAARFDPALSSMRDLFLLLFAAALSATVVSFGYVGTLMIADLLPSRDLVAAGLRYWVGDVIGIAVVAPFALIFLTRRRLPEISAERAAQLVAIVASLVLVLVYARSSHLQLFYLLFLPIVWIAIRSGLEGVTIGILLTQIGLIFGVQLLSLEEVDLTALQVLLLVLTMTGLVAGAVVTEHRQTELQLRMHQDSLARLARFGSLGELAAAIAHEINQPLTAAGTYARLVVDALASRSVRDPTIADMAAKVTAQVDRAAEILRGLRALIRLDKSGRAPSGIDRIVEETLELCRPEFDRYNIEVKVTLDDRLPPVMVNLLQIEQVVLNVLRNAVEAIHLAGHVSGIITIEAVQLGDTTAEIRIHDTGPGFPPQFKADQLPPLSSTKPEGLGIGLSLCRTIVESHGGRLTSGDSTNGAVVRFTLPIAKNFHD